MSEFAGDIVPEIQPVIVEKPAVIVAEEVVVPDTVSLPDEIAPIAVTSKDEIAPKAVTSKVAAPDVDSKAAASDVDSKAAASDVDSSHLPLLPADVIGGTDVAPSLLPDIPEVPEAKFEKLAFVAADEDLNLNEVIDDFDKAIQLFSEEQEQNPLNELQQIQSVQSHLSAGMIS